MSFVSRAILQIYHKDFHLFEDTTYLTSRWILICEKDTTNSMRLWSLISLALHNNRQEDRLMSRAQTIKWRACTSDRHSTERSTFLDSCSNHLTEGEFESELRKMKMCTLGLSSLLLLRPIFVNRRTLSSLPRLIMSGVTGRKWRRFSLSKEMDGQTHRVTTGRGEEF